MVSLLLQSYCSLGLISLFLAAWLIDFLNLFLSASNDYLLTVTFVVYDQNILTCLLVRSLRYAYSLYLQAFLRIIAVSACACVHGAQQECTSVRAHAPLLRCMYHLAQCLVKANTVLSYSNQNKQTNKQKSCMGQGLVFNILAIMLTWHLMAEHWISNTCYTVPYNKWNGFDISCHRPISLLLHICSEKKVE